MDERQAIITNTMATTGKIFGTDGVRGRYDEGWLTPQRVSALGRAIALADVNGAGDTARALLAHDGRASGPVLEQAIAAGLAEQGVASTSAGLLTTPGLAWLTQTGEYDLGIMISASHNPAEDNGVKVFSSTGEKLLDEVEERVEELLRADDSSATTTAAVRLDPSLCAAYTTYLSEHACPDLDLSGMRIALDCANGASSNVSPRALEALGASVTALHCTPDGENINAGCGSTHPQSLQAVVRDGEYDLGVALDGDGDRCILVDERGELVHGDGIMTVIARWRMTHLPYKDPRIVATVMSNRGLHRALREVGVGVVTVDVGDRQVVEALRRERLDLGGEQSGHIIFGSDHAFIGDGTYTALRILRVLQTEDAPLSTLASPYQEFPQVLLNVPVASKPALEGFSALNDRALLHEGELGEDGRVLLRYSGTETVLRVMVEGPDEERIQEMAQDLADIVSAEIGP
jgi:phosphoglucosamine mutase